MYALDVLVAEHEQVRRLNGVMRNACLAALIQGRADPADFLRFLHIIRNYADRHHHGKEEQMLFREMEAQLGPAAEKLVRNGMLVEHDLGRLYAGQMGAAAERYAQSPDMESLLDMLTNAMAYADLLERHIVRENTVVYPFAQRSLPAETLDALDGETRAFEETAESAALLAEISALLEQLEQTYPRRDS